MVEYSRTCLDRNQIKDINILKQDLVFLFIDPKTETHTPVTKICISMDWCTLQPFIVHEMDR